MEQSEEDQDYALYGLMSCLLSALENLPEHMVDDVKAKTGGDIVTASTNVCVTSGRSTGGRGLVRELVEQCLFSVPQQRGNPPEHGDDDEEEDEVG